MNIKIPRLVIAGLSGDSGKTIVTLSLLAALRRKGLDISVFKKGPDYIDAAWLGKLAGSSCRNLDTYMVESNDVYNRFTSSAAGSDIAIIEGNRGIFDGKDVDGTHSTAGLAKLLKAPVVLIVSAAKTTRTIAAVVNGCSSFCRDINIAGVILNKVAGNRHKNIITSAIEKYCKVPVLGVVPRLAPRGDAHCPALIPSRHLGLVTPSESQRYTELETLLCEIGEKHLDVDGLLNAAGNALPLPFPRQQHSTKIPARVKVGYFKDTVFTFYYPENLQALKAHGAELVPVSSIEDASLPDIDALYIGGGFPETHAERLSQNSSMMESVRKAAGEGLPIYAECGGLIYLSKSLTWNNNRYPMAGLFPVELLMHPKPMGHGYTQLCVDRTNPFFEVGTLIKGHEFHYSGLITGRRAGATCMRVDMGTGLGNNRDGLLHKNTLACYTHIHADSVKGWAPRLVLSAEIYSAKQKKWCLAVSGIRT